MDQICIIIPALEPGTELCGYIETLRAKTAAEVIVVDDGSGYQWRKTFERISAIRGCTVLKHETNRGKGRALKTAFGYVRREKPEIRGVLCVDCDGQHSADDVVRIRRVMEQCPGALILGSRDFSGRDVPLRSWFGNRMTSVLFWLFCGKWIADTQTGFRAFGSQLLDRMLQIPGERFEYETQMLADCIRRGIPIRSEGIRTIYRDGNEGSHFRPVRDSLSILRVLAADLIKFSFSSLFCGMLDLCLFWAAVTFLPRQESFTVFQRIALATIGARGMSAAANYLLNRFWVFERGMQRGRQMRSLPRYLLLCAATAAASAGAVAAVCVSTGLAETPAKILCDAVLFIASYRIQRSWVFAPGGKEGADGS